MAQHDYVIDNQSFPATRSDLNNLFQAIASCNSGTSAPSTTYANQLWYDTTNNKLYIRNEDNDAWIELFVLDQTGDHLEKIGNTITLDGAGNATIDGDLTVGDGHTIGDDGSDNLTLTSSTNENIVIHSTKGFITFGKDASNEWFRTDDAGNLLVGRTSTISSSSSSDVGHDFRSNGTAIHYRDGGASLFLGRQSSDGDIVLFYRDGTPVGSIGSRSGVVTFIVLDPRSGGSGLSASGRAVLPANENGATVDNTIDLGDGSSRFDDIFATNTTIQPSDQTMKQQIASLTSAEITAAKAISKLFKTFKWNDSVEAKGDSARKHTGHIAQEVQQAMTDAGLNAADYAFWCSNTWWETQTDVPAVAAVAEVLDDDGNVVTEAIEAQDAYTRTDIYNTADEAPEGATERTRLGIRYPELLAFIGAATEQRLADIETRLTALEA